MNSRYYNKSQAALIKVMEAFAAEGFPELTLAELAEAVNLGKDTVFRTLYMLQQAGWVEKTPGDRCRLSQDWAQIGYRYLERLIEKRNALQQQIQEFQAIG
jgi:DNA-binding IclR family transcriptional regulator